MVVLILRVESDLSKRDAFDCDPGEIPMVVDGNVKFYPCVVALE